MSRPDWMPAPTSRDWQEDFSHENGNYECHCVECGQTFCGHKRRVICKLCTTKTMTPPITTMSPEEQRIAIAESCGWKNPNHPDALARHEGWWSQKRSVWWIDPHGKDQMISSVPDYLKDLNAMAEAVQTLNDDERHSYSVILAMTFWPLGWRDWEDTFSVSEATAKQRAKAFLKTKGLWK